MLIDIVLRASEESAFSVGVGPRGVIGADARISIHAKLQRLDWYRVINLVTWTAIFIQYGIEGLYAFSPIPQLFIRHLFKFLQHIGRIVIVAEIVQFEEQLLNLREQLALNLWVSGFRIFSRLHLEILFFYQEFTFGLQDGVD